MKLSRKQYLIVCAVFLVMMSGVVLGCIRASQEDILNLRARAGLNAAVYSEDLEKDLQQGIDITESVEDLLIDTDGNIQNFEDVAEHRMEDYIESIQLAPGGVVTDIYPLEGNEAGMIDLMNDPARGRSFNTVRSMMPSPCRGLLILSRADRALRSGIRYFLKIMQDTRNSGALR